MDVGERIGTGKEAEVFAYGAHVAKLYRSGGKVAAFREAAILASIDGSGLPTPRVHEAGRFGDRWGLVMDRAAGPPFATAMLADPGKAAAYLDALVGLQLRVHATPAPQLTDLKLRLAANIDRAPALSASLLRRLEAALDTLPAGERLCHGDFHPYNILGTPGAATIVDWLDATRGAPEGDACRSYLLMRQGAPEIAETYLARYAEAAMIPASAILRWLPVLAAARLAENVPDEEQALLAMAEAV